MANYAPIALQVPDENGQELFSQSVPFELELDVREIMERAFVLSQTTTQPDPLIVTAQITSGGRTRADDARRRRRYRICQRMDGCPQRSSSHTQVIDSSGRLPLHS
jgi:hypothetical protein